MKFYLIRGQETNDIDPEIYENQEDVLADAYEYCEGVLIYEIHPDGHWVDAKEDLALEWFKKYGWDVVNGYGDANEALSHCPPIFQEYLEDVVEEALAEIEEEQAHREFEKGKLHV